MLLPLLSALVGASLPASTAAQTAEETYLLPAGNGPFSTTMQNMELVDHSRPDPWNASHVRRIMISRFDPVPEGECSGTTLVPYMTPATAQVESDTYSQYGYPEGIWAQFRLQICDGASPSSPSPPSSCPSHPNTTAYPAILFGPGGATTRLFYSSLAQELSSHGFTVVTVDHPYEVDIVEFPNGDTILGGAVTFPSSPNDTNLADVVKALDVRAADLSFVIDSLGFAEVVATGHSFAGAASATVMRADRRVRGGVNLDGAMFGAVVDGGFDDGGEDGEDDGRSYILWASSVHNTTSPYNEDWGWGEFWEALEEEPEIWRREITVAGSRHSGYWDLNMCADVANLRPLINGGPILGDVNGTRTWEILGTYMPAYFRFALGIEEPDDILNSPSEDFPEVSILRR